MLSACDGAKRPGVPAEIAADVGDLRRLGIPLERLALSDGKMTLHVRHDHEILHDGFHPAEQTHRWTDGLVGLPATWPSLFAGAWTLDLHLAPSELRYRLDPPTPLRAAA